jgi:hypothetical protein
MATEKTEKYNLKQKILDFGDVLWRKIDWYLWHPHEIRTTDPDNPHIAIVHIISPEQEKAMRIKARKELCNKIKSFFVVRHNCFLIHP